MAFTKPDEGITKFGDQGPIFGLFVESTGFVQDFNIKTSNSEATVEDETGWTVTHGFFNTVYEGSITLIDKTGGTMTSIVSAPVALALENISSAIVPECDLVAIYEQDRKPEQKGFQKTTFTFKAFSNTDYSLDNQGA